MTALLKDYPLSALLQRQQWQLQAAQQAMAQAQMNLQRARDEQRQLAQHQQQALSRAQAATRDAPDPALATNLLNYLEHLRQQHALAQVHMTACEQEHANRLQAAAQLRARVDELESHFAEWCQARLAAHWKRQGSAADDTWTTRLAWAGVRAQRNAGNCEAPT